VTLVFIAAEAAEFSGILRHASSVETLDWPLRFARQGILNGRRAVFAAHGPGPQLAAQVAREAAKRLKNVEAFISTGFCGALDAELRPGDIVIGNYVNGEAVRTPEIDIGHTQAPVVSEDRVACTVEEKRALRKRGNAVEMEAAGVLNVADELRVPFYCVRAVTDAADEALPLDFNIYRDKAGRFSRPRIVIAACRRPMRTFPALMRLQKNCKSAAAALGDFVANCRF